MIVEFLPQAKSELMDAAGYYEGQLIGLGQRFWEEVDQHIIWITENPEVPLLRAGGYQSNVYRASPMVGPFGPRRSGILPRCGPARTSVCGRSVGSTRH
jgi:hypothetical protein